jgi:plasmid maintenance system antidote protein VapI
MKKEHKFKTRTELAEEMGISRKTLYNLISKHNIDVPNGLLTPDVVDQIVQIIGKNGLKN